VVRCALDILGILDNKALAGYCKDCKYWNKLDKTCSNTEWLDIEDCVMACYSNNEDDEPGLYEGMRVGPLFGCIHFEEK